MRWAAVGFVVLLLIIAAVAWARPDLFPGIGEDLPNLIWLVMALILVGASAFAVSQRQPAGGPGPFTSLLIWAGLLGLVMLLARGAEFWAALVSLFS